MDLGLIIATAEAAEEHKSEAPFFILGGALAAFALLISVVGFTRPDFPDSSGASRAVMGAGAVLVIATAWAILYVSG